MQSTISETAQRRRIAEAFANADARSTGRLMASDVKVAWIELFGYKPCKRELQLILQAQPPPSGAGLSLEVFERLALARMSRLDPDGQLRHAFAAFDWRGQNFIRLEDFHRAVRELAPRLPEFSIERAFAEADSDSDGRVTFRDFEFAIKFEPDR